MEQNKINLIELMIRDVEELIKVIDGVLVSNGINTPDKKLSTISHYVKNLRTINPNKDYISIIKDRNGYVTDYVRTNDIINEQELPDDFTYGYYKVTEVGEIYKDELQKLKLMED